MFHITNYKSQRTLYILFDMRYIYIYIYILWVYVMTGQVSEVLDLPRQIVFGLFNGITISLSLCIYIYVSVCVCI